MKKAPSGAFFMRATIEAWHLRHPLQYRHARAGMPAPFS
jgi:hypothetical protein